MSVIFYIPQENGNLKLAEEVEGTTDIEAAREALFEAVPRLAKQDEFVVIVTEEDSLEAGVVTMLRKQEVTQTAWVTQVEVVADDEDEGEEEEEDEAPAPKRRQTRKAPARKAAAKKAPAKRGTKKAPAKKATRKKASGAKSPFTRNPASEE